MTGSHAHAIPRERMSRLRAMFRRDNGDGTGVIETLEEQQRGEAEFLAGPPWDGTSQPGQPSYPYPLRAPEFAHDGPPPVAVLQKLADGLRALDGPDAMASPGYRAIRAAIETVPFRAVGAEEAPAPAPAPFPWLPALAADLADLPLFRESLSRRTRCHGRECLCGQEVAGDTWGGRMVAAGAHLLLGAAADRGAR